MPRLVAALASLLLACGTTVTLEPADAGAPDAAADSGREADSGPSDEAEPGASDDVAPPASCERQIDARGLSPLTDAHARYLADLPEVVVHARVDPVLFLRWPDEAPRSEEAALTRSAIARASRPSRALRELIRAHEDNPAYLREVVLSDGYLFAREPRFARALSSEVALEALFDAPLIYRVRDGVVYELTRTADGSYVDDGGRRASLRLNDRVVHEEAALEDALGLDLEVVRGRTHALRTVPQAIGPAAAALELRFPDGTRRPSLVELRHGATEVVCVGGDPASLDATLEDAARFFARHDRLRQAAEAIVAQRVRFDEPVNEPEGVQEDGQLRRAWRQAYFRGETTFTYRDVEYPVYHRGGDAMPPQVCVDFVFDAYSRALGSFYRRRGEPLGRPPGALDLEDVPGLPRRSIAQLVSYARTENAVVDRYDVPRAERVALQDGRAYSRAIARFSDQVQPGDALIIHGLRLQDMNLHYHAVLVIRTEPMTGVPMVVADNQGRPRFRSLAGAMRAAPLRSIKHRLRFDLEAARVASRAAG